MFEIFGETAPVADERKVSRERKSTHVVEPRGCKQRIGPLKERRGRRQRNEMRDIAGEQVRHANRSIAAFAADMDMLAEYGELLREIPVQVVNVLVARRVEDALVMPLLERMRAAAGDPDVEPARLAYQRVANGFELGERAAVSALDRGADLDHRFRELGFDLAGVRDVFDQFEEIPARPGQIVVAGVQNLELELDAQRMRLRSGEVQGAHRTGQIKSVLAMTVHTRGHSPSQAVASELHPTKTACARHPPAARGAT